MWDDGVFFVYYSVGVSSGVFCALQMMGVWIENLPNQVKFLRIRFPMSDWWGRERGFIRWGGLRELRRGKKITTFDRIAHA